MPTPVPSGYGREVPRRMLRWGLANQGRTQGPLSVKEALFVGGCAGIMGMLAVLAEEVHSHWDCTVE